MSLPPTAAPVPAPTRARRPQQPALASSGVGGWTIAIGLALALTAGDTVWNLLTPLPSTASPFRDVIGTAGIVNLAIFLASLALGILDYRALQSRGIDRPMHWGWMVLSVAYMIGRGVVLRRRIGRGLAPTFVYIVIVLAGFVLGFV